jgi:hypothetical protein
MCENQGAITPAVQVLVKNRKMQAQNEYAQGTLQLEGVVVIQTPLVDNALRAETRAAFEQHILESPEFRDPNPSDPTWKPQLGGFACMANPSSFHHPLVRKLREMCTGAVLDADVLPLEGRKLEKPFDRLMYRISGEKPTAESMHRDEAMTALPSDVVFGGWINLDDEPQYFSCAPRTHHEVGGQNKGFAKITSKEEKEKYKPLFRRVEIPPGCILVFYERLVHEVNPVQATSRVMRMMLGWRVTDANEPLFGEATTAEWIRDQGVPKIKSGQDPPVWPSAYSNFPRNFQTLTDWSRRTYVDQCLYTHSVAGTGAAAGTRWIRVKAKMLSLREYNLAMHPAYDEHENRLLRPHREWLLYTFDSPQARVQFKAPSPSDWQSFLAARHAVPLGAVVRRPAPERL